MARILVIDDDAEIRTLVKKFLVMDGHEVDKAENGAVGLKMAGLHQYDLVITDVIMPEQDGIGVIMELKQLFPDMRIIVMTGGSAKLSIDHLLTMTKLMKADRSIAKPLDFEKLHATVREVLGAVKP